MRKPNDNPAGFRKQDLLGLRAAVFSDGFARSHAKALLALLFLVHAAATLFFFPPADIVNERPVITLDHSFHYYQARRANEVFPKTGRLHMYDPHFMAGFPTALFDIDVKTLEVVCAPFPASQVARVMKFFILFCYLSMVFTVYAGCRCLRLTERESLLAVALLLVFWHWGRPLASHFRYAGMFDFVCVSHLSILVAGLFQRFLEGNRAVWWLVLGPLAYFIHPTAVVILFVPYACLLLCDRREITRRKLLLFGLWCLIVILVNSVWIIPLFEYASAKTATRAFFQTSGAGALAGILFRPGCAPAVLLIALAVAGTFRLARGGRVPTAVMVSATFLFLLAVSAYGVYVPGLRDLEPGRFLFSSLVFSVPLGGVGMGLLLDHWGRWSSKVRFARPLGTAALAVLLLCPVLLSYLSARTGYEHRLTTTLAPEVAELIGELQRRTDPSARLMIEDGPAAMYGDAHIPGLLPLHTGVGQIGGPYPFTFLQHHFATFQKDLTMGKPLESLSAAEFWSYLDAYNVRWIVAASPEVKAYVAAIAADSASAPAVWKGNGAPLESVWKSRRYELWVSPRPPSFTTGAARPVTAGFDRIQVDTRADGEPFVLRFHWDRGLRARAPARISPVHVSDDPVPFIRVDPHGATSVLIEY